MAAIRSKGGLVLNKYLLARVFAYDDHAEEARAACIAKGWGDVRRGPPWMIETADGCSTCATISADNSMLAVSNNIGYNHFHGPLYRDGPLYYKHETVVYDVSSGEVRFELSSSLFVTAAAFSPDSKAVAIGTKSVADSHTYDRPLYDVMTTDKLSGKLSIYNIATDSSTELRWGRISPKGVSIVQFSPSGSTVFVGCVNGICSLYDASSGQLVRRLQRELRHGGPITMACFASDSMLAVSDHRDDGKHKLTLFDTTTGLQRWEKVSTRSDEFFVGCAAFSQDRATLAVRDGA